MNKGQIESRVFVNQFSKSVDIIATLKNVTTLVEKNGAIKNVQLLILQHFMREYLPKVWSTLSSIQTADDLFSELVKKCQATQNSRNKEPQ